MPIRLVILQQSAPSGSTAEDRVLPDDTVEIGRAEDATVTLSDAAVSRNHARITCDGILYFIEDLGSTYGTRLNGAPLPKSEKRLLRTGDVIAVGPYDMTFYRLAESSRRESGGNKSSNLVKQVVKDAMKDIASGEGPSLRVMTGEYEGRRYPLAEAQEIIVGREETCDIVLHDDLVSRRHCKVRRDWSGIHAEDLGSRNGVQVNKKKITVQTTLKDGDELIVGTTRFLFLDSSDIREDSTSDPSGNKMSAEPGTDMNAVPDPSHPMAAAPSSNEPAPLGMRKSPGTNGAAPAGTGPGSTVPTRSESVDKPSRSSRESEGSRAKAPEVTPDRMKGLKGTRPGPADGIDWKHIIPIVVGVAILVAGIGFLLALFLWS